MKATQKYRLTLKHDRNTEEYIVRVADKYGKSLPDLDYYTDCKEDAINTMKAMNKDLNK